MSDKKNEEVENLNEATDKAQAVADKKTSAKKFEYTTFPNDFSLSWSLPGVGKKRPADIEYGRRSFADA